MLSKYNKLVKCNKLRPNILFSEDLVVQQQLYLLFNNTSFCTSYDIRARWKIVKDSLTYDTVKCPVCENTAVFDRFKFLKYCSKECMYKDKPVQKKWSKLGIQNISQLPEHKKKVKQSWKNKTQQDKKDILKKRKKTISEKHLSYKKYCIQNNLKGQQTCFTRYGVKSYLELINNNGLSNINYEHFKNIDLYFDKKFIIDKFIIDDLFDYHAFMNFFNCCQPTAHNHLKKMNIDYTKKSGGIDVLKPGKLYYLEIQHHEKLYYKIGITNFDVKSRFKSKNDMDKIKIIFEIDFDLAINALIIEQKIIKKNKQYITDQNILSSGNTEIFNIDINDINLQKEINANRTR